jgi:hypothetical protein
LVARVWALGSLAGEAQMRVEPGFILCAEGAQHTRLSTGVADWEAKPVAGYDFDHSQRYGGHYFAVEARVVIDGQQFPWGVEAGQGEGWQPVVIGARAVSEFKIFGAQVGHILQPAVLPPMISRERQVGRVALVSEPPSVQTREVAVKQADHRLRECKLWSALLSGKKSITIEPRTRRRVIVDWGNYYCGYTGLITTGGKGSQIRLSWTEALYGETKKWTKGNRDEIEGKYFYGLGDLFKPDGGRRRRFMPLWWNAGRYVELVVETGDEPLTIEKFILEETRYPLEMESEFTADDRRLERVIPIAVRGLQMCSHETYMDCPFFEQLMYVGDTRLEVLTTLVLTRDDRLPRKALQMFDASRRFNGLTQSRYPSMLTQVIPPFSLWWVAMVHDYALWRDDPKFVATLMPGVRGVLEAFLGFRGDDGLVSAPPGWNFMDWVPDWERGIPPDGELGTSALINWQFALVLTQAADLEEWNGEPALAGRYRAYARQLAAKLGEVFWDARCGLFADDCVQEHFSEHTQCLALLSGLLTEDKRWILADSLLKNPRLERTTIYFTHYLFEAYRTMGAMDALLDRLGLWFALEKQGSKTTVEMPEPTRSDCHAWGAHPLFHYFATILGIRPGSPGFRTIRIEPQLGRLKHLRGSLIHPLGKIVVDFSIHHQRLRGSIALPSGVCGELIYKGNIVPLQSRRQTIDVG